jgi:hypothetical protein
MDKAVDCIDITWLFYLPHEKGGSNSSHSYFCQIILVLSLRLLKLCVLFYYDIKGLEFVSNNRSMNVLRHFYITGMRNFLRSLKYPSLVILLVNIYAVYWYSMNAEKCNCVYIILVTYSKNLFKQGICWSNFFVQIRQVFWLHRWMIVAQC